MPKAAIERVRISIFVKGLLLVLLPFLAQLIFNSVQLHRQRQVETSQRWALHTKDVISRSEMVLGRLTEAHMHLQGELLGVPVPHGPMHDLHDFDSALDQLVDLVRDNSSQMERARVISEKSKSYASWYLHAHELDRTAPEVVMILIAELPQARAKLNTVREELKRFVASEEQLDMQRSRELAASMELQWVVMWLGLGISVLATAVAVMLFSRSISRRLAVLSANVGRLTKGETLAARIDGNDELSDLDASFHQMARTLEMAAATERGHARELETRAQELAATNAELSQRTQEVEMFVYSVSHDLRSPLINLQGFSKELALSCGDLGKAIAVEGVPASVQTQVRSLLDGEVAEAVRFIQNAVSRLAGIIDALLRLSRAGRIEYHPQQLDMNRIVRRVTDALNDSLNKRGASVAIQPLPPVWGDPVAIEQAFGNLVGNAINYLSPERPGRIEIGSVPSPPEDAKLVTLYVRDNGLGIPESGAKNLFRAFQRFHPKAAEGEGIGLAVVRKVIERHGGRIYCESKPGQGSTFFVALPRSGSGSSFASVMGGNSSESLQPVPKPGIQT